MAGITQAQAQQQLDLWINASTAVAQGQSYEIGDRKLTRVDAGEIRRMIDFWSTKLSLATSRTAGRSRARTIVPGG